MPKGKKKSSSGFSSSISSSVKGINGDIDALFKLETKVMTFEKKSENSFKSEIASLSRMKLRQQGLTTLFNSLKEDYVVAFDAGKAFINELCTKQIPEYDWSKMKEKSSSGGLKGEKVAKFPAGQMPVGTEFTKTSAKDALQTYGDGIVNTKKTEDCLSAVMGLEMYSSYNKKALKLLGMSTKIGSLKKKMESLLKKKMAEETKEFGSVDYIDSQARGELLEPLRKINMRLSAIMKKRAIFIVSGGDAGNDALKKLEESLKNSTGDSFFTWFGTTFKKDTVKANIKNARDAMQAQILELRKLEASLKKKDSSYY